MRWQGWLLNYVTCETLAIWLSFFKNAAPKQICWVMGLKKHPIDMLRWKVFKETYREMDNSFGIFFFHVITLQRHMLYPATLGKQQVCSWRHGVDIRSRGGSNRWWCNTVVDTYQRKIKGLVKRNQPEINYPREKLFWSIKSFSKFPLVMHEWSFNTQWKTLRSLVSC